MTATRLSLRCASIALLASLTCLACAGSASSDTESRATYTLGFPSTEAAVVTDFVKVQVFDATGKPALCQELVNKRLTKQALPVPIVDAKPVRVCDMFTRAAQYALPVAYGERALLAVATRKDADFLVGCAQVTAATPTFDVPLALTLVSGDVLPPDTTCTSLVDHCNNGC